jgi:hypothetical protein
MRPNADFPWATFVAGVAAGVVFCAGVWVLDIGGIQSLVIADRDGIVATAMSIPLLALFGISALATHPSDDGTVGPSRPVRSLRPATVAAVRRPRPRPHG